MEMLEGAMQDLLEHPTLGIIRLDYDYPSAPGDIDHPGSFSYPVVYRVVPGLTFAMIQLNELTPEVSKEVDRAILWLAEDQKVSAITGDCGFMMWLESRARQITKVPVFLSSLMQLPTISASLCKQSDKIIVLTANVKSLQPMQHLINQVTGCLEEQEHFVYVGCEDVPHFGKEVEEGLKVDTAKAEPGILAKVQAAIAATPGARALLLECTELPAYSDAIRAATGLPVFDAITNCDFIMGAFLDNERFGINDFYKKWDGNQKDYTFGQNLTDSQLAKLVSKPVNDKSMDMILQKLQKSQLFDELAEMGFSISVEQAAHAIAEQIEMNEIRSSIREIRSSMEEAKQELKTEKRRFRRVRDFVYHVAEKLK
jgi:hypothetical protein